jgi:hypothetical protein
MKDRVMNVLKGYRTLILAVLQFAAGVIAISTDAVTILPEDVGLPLIISSVVFAVMRFVTNTPVLKSSSQ